MKRILKVDNDFSPCPVTTGDELFPNGIFEFNITKMLEHIQQNPRSIALEEVPVCGFPKEFSRINENHMDYVELSRPVILAEICPGRYNLIDGHHRMEKARRMGMKSIPAYKLNVEQHLQFLTDKKAYIAYVEYWNSKMKRLDPPKTRARHGLVKSNINS